MGLKKAIKRFLSPQRTVEVLCSVPERALCGKRILITGGSSGIGFATAKKCVSSGADVVITSRPGSARLGKALAELEAAKGLEWDIGNPDDREKKLEEALDLADGNYDCVFLNAGIYTAGVGAWQRDSVDELFEVNLHSNLQLINALTGKWVSSGVPGTILVTGSNRGMMPDCYPYGLTKVALHSFVQGMAREYAKYSIRINAIAPGMTATGINGIDSSGDLSRTLSTIGDSRVIRPEEIAEVAAFLLSDRSICINGAIIPCDLGDNLR